MRQLTTKADEQKEPLLVRSNEVRTYAEIEGLVDRKQ